MTLKCKCQRGHTTVNATACVQSIEVGHVLGQPCNANGDCHVSHSQCKNNHCRCVDGFHGIGDSVCAAVPQLMAAERPVTCILDNECGQNSRCDYSDQLYSGVCVCKEGFAEFDDGTCQEFDPMPLTVLGSRRCEEDQECSILVPNSDCNRVSFTCKCRAGYQQVGDNLCIKKEVEVPKTYEGIFKKECLRNETCSSLLDYTFCNPKTRRCDCVEGYRPSNENKCSALGILVPGVLGISRPTTSSTTTRKPLYIGDQCSDTYPCSVDNGICFSFQCQCEFGYEPVSPSQCVRKKIGSTCDHDMDCETIPAAYCIENVCNCDEGFKPNRRLTRCGAIGIPEPNPEITDINGLPCEQDDNCTVPHSSCIDGICQCSIGYYPVSLRKCELRKIDDTCQRDEDCRIWTPIAICPAITQKCTCPPGYTITPNRSCVMITSTSTTTTTTATPPKRLIGEQCTWGTGDCVVERSYCSDNYTCQCDMGYKNVGISQCVLKRIGDQCYQHGDCQVGIPQAICTQGQCMCSEGFLVTTSGGCRPVGINPSVPIRDTTLAPSFIGDPCTRSSDCVVQQSRCGEDNRCQCLFGYFGLNKTTCLPVRIGDKCGTTDECQVHVPRSYCLNNYCVCPLGLVATSLTECTAVTPPPRILGSPCLRDQDCSRVSGSICLSGICSCSPGLKQVGNEDKCESVVDQIGRNCTNNGDCSNIPNTECLQGRCQCSFGFKVDVPNNRSCSPTLLDDKCMYDVDCSTNVENSSCVQVPSLNTNLCKCNAGFQPVGKIYCQPSDQRILAEKIGQDCSSNADCSKLPNTLCFSGKCMCLPAYKVDQPYNTSCSKIRIGDQCSRDAFCLEGIAYSKCNNQQCVCSDGYETKITEDEDRCIFTPIFCPSGLCKYNEIGCAQSGKPCETRNAQCVSDRCTCPPGMEYETNLDTCVPIQRNRNFGEFCKSDDYCIDTFICKKFQCDCPPGTAYNGDRCVMREIGDACRSDQDCSFVINGKCKTCQCQNFTMETWETRQRLNKTCQCGENYLTEKAASHEFETLDGTKVCTKRYCGCDDGYHATGPQICTVKRNEVINVRSMKSSVKCQSDNDCFGPGIPMSSICGSSGYCICPQGTEVDEDGRCSPIKSNSGMCYKFCLKNNNNSSVVFFLAVGWSCRVNADCPSGLCIKNVCQPLRAIVDSSNFITFSWFSISIPLIISLIKMP